MSVLQNIAAIAKGMSITFMRCFQPTTLENYPDEQRSAARRPHRSPLPRRSRSAARRKRTGKMRRMFPLRRQLPSNCILHQAADNTAEHRVSARNATPRFITSTTIDVFFAVLRGGLSHRCDYARAWFELRRSMEQSGLPKEQMLAARPAHMGRNVVFNQATWMVESKEMVAGVECSSSYQHAVLGAGVCAWCTWYLVASQDTGHGFARIHNR